MTYFRTLHHTDAQAIDLFREIAVVFGEEYGDFILGPLGGHLHLNADTKQRLHDLGIPWYYETQYSNGAVVRVHREHELMIKISFDKAVVQKF